MGSESKVARSFEWPFGENGAERIHTALVKAEFCNLKCVLVNYMSKWAVSSQCGDRHGGLVAKASAS